MQPVEQRLFWNAVHIGTVENFRIDNFDCYGIWNPRIDCAVYTDFINAVECEEGATVAIGSPESKLLGTVELVPDDEIQIKIR